MMNVTLNFATAYALYLFFVLWFVSIFLMKHANNNDGPIDIVPKLLLTAWCAALFVYMLIVAPFAIPMPFIAWACWVVIDKVFAKRRLAA